MSNPPRRPWTLHEFLAWEELQPDKWELVDGMAWAMAGGTQAHARIPGNVFAAFHAATRGGPCATFASDLKIVAPDFAAYPDVSVVCGNLRDELTVAENRLVVVEVLSRSTRDRDYGAKWLAYQKIPSLRYYVLIDQEQRRIDVLTPEPSGWRATILTEPTA